MASIYMWVPSQASWKQINVRYCEITGIPTIVYNKMSLRLCVMHAIRRVYWTIGNLLSAINARCKQEGLTSRMTAKSARINAGNIKQPTDFPPPVFSIGSTY